MLLLPPTPLWSTLRPVEPGARSVACNGFGVWGFGGLGVWGFGGVWGVWIAVFRLGDALGFKSTRSNAVHPCQTLNPYMPQPLMLESMQTLNPAKT